MSLSLRSTPDGQALSGRRSPNQIDPVPDLKYALSNFGAILTDDERKKLQAQKTGLNDADAAFKFTLKLDELDPVQRGRVTATRLCSLLQTVQSFGQVVETYVSSNPEIAALIWGTVKLTFMVLINFTSYFQRFTDLLSGFDHLIPHFTAYEKLFPKSEQLKKSICNFHLAIITCCKEIVLLTRLPWHEKLRAALTMSFEAKIRPFLDNIRAAASKAKDEVDLAKAQQDQTNHAEQQKNERSILQRTLESKRLMRRMKNNGEGQAKLHKWQSLLKKLSSFKHESAYRNARSKRHKGTAQWVFETQQFQDWHHTDSSNILNIAGKIGSGKTVLTANIIDHLMRHKTKQQIVSFFFVRFDDIYSQSSEVIIRSLACQTLARASVDDSLLELMEKSDALMFDSESLLDVLSHQIALLDDYFLVIDGLDECNMSNRRSILKFLTLLRQKCLKGRVKVIVSARDSVTNQVHSFFPSFSRVIVGSDETNRDLTLFAHEILAEKQRGDWSVGDPKLIDTILHSIGLGGEGMFLWVYLTIEDITTRRTDEDVRQALSDIPRNLPDTFDRVLQRIESKGNTEVVCSVFMWTAAACYPLALEQLSEVLNIKVNQLRSQASGRVNGIQHLPAWCESLIQVEEGSQTVHFSHHSIRAYLLGPKKKEIPAFNLDFEACDDFIGEICLTYLHFSDFQTALSDRHCEKPVTLEHIPLGVIENTFENIGANSYGRSIITRFAKMPSGKPQSIPLSRSLQMDELNVSADSAATDHFPFARYAQDNWSRHTVRISPSSEAWSLWQKTDVSASYAPWTNLEWRTPGIATSDWTESYDDIRSASRRNLTSDYDFETCVSLHKAIAFSDLLGHQPLLMKVISKLIECQLPASPPLLERLMQPRAADTLFDMDSTFVESAPTHSELLQAHELVISCVTRYTARGGHRWPRNFSGSVFCSQPTEGECWKIIHRQSSWILRGHQHLNDGSDADSDDESVDYFETQISESMQAQARTAITDFTEAAFTQLMGNILEASPKHEIPPLFQIAIERGNPWCTRAIDLLVRNEESQDQRYEHVIKVLAKAHDVTSLVHLLDTKSLASSGGLNAVQVAVLESVLVRETPWLPGRLRQRLIKHCVPSSCKSQFRQLQELLLRAVKTSNWDISVALCSCIFASMPTANSAFGLLDAHLDEMDMMDLMDCVLSCIVRPTQWQQIIADGRCQLLPPSEGGPKLRCCEDHTRQVRTIIAKYDSGGGYLFSDWDCILNLEVQTKRGWSF